MFRTFFDTATAVLGRLIEVDNSPDKLWTSITIVIQWRFPASVDDVHVVVVIRRIRFS